MTALFSPDIAPDLEPGVVRWQRRPAGFAHRDLERSVVGIAAVVVLSVGLGAAIAVVAGRLASGRASGPKRFVRSRFRRPF